MVNKKWLITLFLILGLSNSTYSVNVVNSVIKCAQNHPRESIFAGCCVAMLVISYLMKL